MGLEELRKDAKTYFHKLGRQSMRRFQLLSILHYIWGGLYLLLGLFWFRFYFDFSAYQSQMHPSICIYEPFKGDACDTWIVFFTICIHLFTLGVAVVNLLAAFSYQRVKTTTANWMAACLNLLSFPLGTALGIYSLYALKNYLPELQELYND